MSKRLTGQSALVTGAGRGFGRAIAMRLAADGAAVTLVSRSRAELDGVAEEIRASGGTAAVATADVSNPAQVKSACDVARTEHGAPSLLVSNAGVPWPVGPLWETDIDRWWQAQGIHVRGPYLLMHELMPDMVKAKAGRVICISAIATRLAFPFLSAYGVGKSALNKIVELAAVEGRPHNVQVFAVEPGFAITQLAEDTYNDPDARKWIPHLLDNLDSRRGEPDGEGDLHRTAERCAVLAAGDYDILSGRYMELTDPIDEWKRAADYAAETEPN